MLNIYICEDDINQLKKYTKIIEDILLINNFDMEIVLSTVDPYKVLESVKSNDNPGLYFLDVDLKSEINGIQLGTEIREYDPRGFIIYITAHSELSYLTFDYKVEALDYIIKDEFENLKTRIRECIENVEKKYSTKINELQRVFHVKSGGREFHIEFDKILFFEISDRIHKIKLHATDRKIEFYGQLSKINDELDNRFYRCHNSYLINTNKIKEIDTKLRIIHFVNGQTCPTSFRRLKGLKYL